MGEKLSVSCLARRWGASIIFLLTLAGVEYAFADEFELDLYPKRLVSGEPVFLRLARLPGEGKTSNAFSFSAQGWGPIFHIAIAQIQNSAGLDVSKTFSTGEGAAVSGLYFRPIEEPQGNDAIVWVGNAFFKTSVPDGIYSIKFCVCSHLLQQQGGGQGSTLCTEVDVEILPADDAVLARLFDSYLHTACLSGSRMPFERDLAYESLVYAHGAIAAIYQMRLVKELCRNGPANLCERIVPIAVNLSQNPSAEACERAMELLSRKSRGERLLSDFEEEALLWALFTVLDSRRDEAPKELAQFLRGRKRPASPESFLFLDAL